MAAGDLCTLADVKLSRRGLPAALDTLISSLITPASVAVADWADRQFVVDGAPSTRIFPIFYPAPTDIAIDDLSATPSAVSLIDPYGATTTALAVATDVIALPRNRRSDEPIERIRLRPNVAIYGQRWELSVTGTFGFPVVPEPVKRAAIATVADWLRSSQGLTPQTPDPFEPGALPSRGLPREALDLLRPYRRIDLA